jgi:hypothetical protein
MKKLLILLCLVPALMFGQSYPSATKVFEWSGTIDASKVYLDTVIQYTGLEEAAGLTCSCSFDFSGLNRDSSVLKMGGSNIVLTKSGTTTYYKWAPASNTDSTFMRKAAFKQTYRFLGASYTSYIVNLKVSPYGVLKPQFQWKKNGKVTSGTLAYKCMFSRN